MADLPPASESSEKLLPMELLRLGVNWGWFLGLGLFFVVAGILSVVWPVDSTLGATYALGVFFLLAGVATLIKTIELRKSSGTGFRIVQTVILLVAGLVVMRSPQSGMFGITIGMTFYFFAISAARGIAAFELRPLKGWGWMLAGAVASFLLGAFAMVTFPLSSLWMPGLLLGIDFIVYGSCLTGLAFLLRELRSEERHAPKSVPASEEKKRAA